MKMVIPPDILQVLETLAKYGFEGYLVGGCVRDFYLGNEIHDFDITTSATPQQIKICFPNVKSIPAGERHGTVIVNTGYHFVEITTFRVDSDYSDSRHPNSVKFTKNLASDLSRRDFTINAMAYSPQSGLVDIFGGMDDIRNKVIRCVGTAEKRFNEDALRILRGLRFAARFGFKLENKTAIAAYSQAKLLKNISAERISAELLGILAGGFSGLVLSAFADTINEVFKLDYTRLSTMTDALKNSPNDIKVRLCIFVLGTAGLYEDTVTALKLPSSTAGFLLAVCNNFNCEIPTDEVSAKFFLNRFGNDCAMLILAVKRAYGADTDTAQKITEKIVANGSCYSLSTLEINGDYLMQLGAPSGKTIGKILKLLLDAVMRGELKNDRNCLICAAKKLLDN